MGVLVWIILIALLGLLVWLYFKFIKIPKIKNIVFIDGSLGCGKSYYSVALAVKLYKRARFRYRLKLVFSPLIKYVRKLRKLEYCKPEEPLLYSNIRLRNIRFVRINKELIFRQNRFAYGSVLLLDEFSLMADQYTYKDRGISERLSLFFKLFRHETKGGYIVINSQSTSDLHYSLKYVLSEYFYIHHRRKFPFLTALQVQEMIYNADKEGGGVVNTRDEDIERANRLVLCGNRFYKYYDSYCYSIFTDGLPVYGHLEFNGKGDSLKCPDLVSFKEYRYLTEKMDNAQTKDI